MRDETIISDLIRERDAMRDALVKHAVYYDVERAELVCKVCGKSTWKGLNVPHHEACLLYP